MSLVQLQSSISEAIAKSQYNINTVFNASLYGVPLMTVGLIGVTSMVLAYVTLVESNDSSTPEPGSSESMIPKLPEMPQMPEIPDFGIQKAISSVAPESMRGEESDELAQTAKGGKSNKTKISKKKSINKKKTRRLHKK